MIIDSSSLIIFAKINQLRILEKLYSKIDITQEIYKETVDEGMKINASDAKIIKSFFDEGKIKIISLNEKYTKFSRELINVYSQIDCGESDAISLCLQEEQKTFIIDESIGRKIAKLYGLKPVGSLRVLLEAYINELIDERELKELVQEMVKNKFRLGGDVMNEFWRIFEKIKEKKEKIN